MDKVPVEKRKFERYDTEVKIYFYVSFDIKTIVKFIVVGKDKKKTPDKKYLAFSKNVSAEGLCFTSDKKLKKGNILSIEIYLPKQENPILMEGEVRWSQLVTGATNKFDTGVCVATVKGKSVSDSIYRDEKNRIVWSAVLESVFGNFRKFAQQQLK